MNIKERKRKTLARKKAFEEGYNLGKQHGNFGVEERVKLELKEQERKITQERNNERFNAISALLQSTAMYQEAVTRLLIAAEKKV